MIFKPASYFLLFMGFVLHAYGQQKTDGVTGRARQTAPANLSPAKFADSTEIVIPPSFSGNGYAHTAKGNLHSLIIFVTFASGATDYLPGWAANALPEYAANGDFISTRPGEHPGRTNNLTNWFKKVSHDSFTVTGECFLVTIPKKLDDFFKMYRQVLDSLPAQHPGIDWTRFDQRENNPVWGFDNSRSSRSDAGRPRPDGIIDYCVLNFRRNDGPVWTGYSSNDLLNGMWLRWGDPKNKSSLQAGAGHTAHFITPDIEHQLDYFRHEFSHVLFNAPHYMGANNLPGTRFYTNKGWGIMGETHKPVNTSNAWECWWLDWMEPQTITQSGRYKLKDFITGHDAIRIPLGNGSDVLWLENHQKLDPADDKVFYKKESPMAPGIYAFISTRGNNRNRAHEFYPGSNENTNSMKVLNAGGNFNYTYEDSAGVRYFSRKMRNIIAGQHEQTLIRQDFDHDGTIPLNVDWNHESWTRNEQQAILHEKDKEYPWSGDAGMVFKTGDRIGFSENVIATGFPVYNATNSWLEPYNLYPLSIFVESYDSIGHSYTISVDLDDPVVKKNTEWSGPLRIRNNNGTPAPDLVIGSTAKLTVSLSGTPTTHKKNNLTNDLVSLGIFIIDSQATVLIRPNASFHFNALNALELGHGAVIRLQRSAMLSIEDIRDIRFGTSGKISFEEGATIIVRNKSVRFVCTDNKIYLKDSKGSRLVSGSNTLNKLQL